MGNRKLQFVVRRSQFRVAMVSNFSKEFDLRVFDASMLFFVKSKCITFVVQKARIIIDSS